MAFESTTGRVPSTKPNRAHNRSATRITHSQAEVAPNSYQSFRDGAWKGYSHEKSANIVDFIKIASKRVDIYHETKSLDGSPQLPSIYPKFGKEND